VSWSVNAWNVVLGAAEMIMRLCTIVMQVVQHMLGLPVTHMREQIAADTDSDEEDLNNRINRLWRPSLQPLVKSYSHASM